MLVLIDRMIAEVDEEIARLQEAREALRNLAVREHVGKMNGAGAGRPKRGRPPGAKNKAKVLDGEMQNGREL